MSRAFSRTVLIAIALMCLGSLVAAAQTTTTTETKSFQVIAVNGNNLVVKLPEGTREMTVPEDFRFTVNGQPLSVHELKPGMTGTAVITTKTTVTPVTVTEVKNGTVVQASGSSILVRTDEGFKRFMEGDAQKRGATILRDGQPVSMADLHTGDKLTATIITSAPPKVMTEKEVDVKTAQAGEAPAPAHMPSHTSGHTSGRAAHKLPKTASSLPLLGIVGGAFLLIGISLTASRRYWAR